MQLVRRFIGAGGNWRRYGEVFGPPGLVRQVTICSCAYACIQMMAAQRGLDMTQPQIAGENDLHEPAETESLDEILNRVFPAQRWRSIYVAAERSSLLLLGGGCPWIAGLRSLGHRPTGMSVEPEHAVLITQVRPRKRRVRVADPYDPSTYEMAFPDFEAHWTGFAAFAVPIDRKKVL